MTFTGFSAAENRLQALHDHLHVFVSDCSGVPSRHVRASLNHRQSSLPAFSCSWWLTSPGYQNCYFRAPQLRFECPQTLEQPTTTTVKCIHLRIYDLTFTFNVHPIIATVYLHFVKYYWTNMNINEYLFILLLLTVSCRDAHALTINFLISFYTPETMFYTVYFLVVQIIITILGQGVTILC